MSIRLSPTLSVYIGRQFLLSFLTVFGVLLAIIFLIDFIELMRRASGKPGTTVSLVLTMALYKAPHVGLKTVPFAVLFAGMFAFWRLNRNQELVVVRASGVSVWQFILPVVAVALLIGTLKLIAFNPVAATMVSRYEQMESKFLRGRTSLIAVSSTGVWLRQVDDVGTTVIHAERVGPGKMELQKVMVLVYEGEDRFLKRIDAVSAKLVGGNWELLDAWVSSPERPPSFTKRHLLPTRLTQNKILENFASPETISFWDLPDFIKVLEATGFATLSHRLHWHSLLAEPLLLFAMVLVAAAFSLRHGRKSGVVLAAGGGVFAGFMLFFVTVVVLELGRSTSIPVMLAAWTPAGASTLLGLTTLLHLEDG